VAEFNKTANEQTERMIRLTRQLVVLTWLLLAGLIVQVVVALTG
jgi:hypothetical protein